MHSIHFTLHPIAHSTSRPPTFSFDSSDPLSSSIQSPAHSSLLAARLQRAASLPSSPAGAARRSSPSLAFNSHRSSIIATPNNNKVRGQAAAASSGFSAAEESHTAYTPHIVAAGPAWLLHARPGTAAPNSHSNTGESEGAE
jgi:hypothetical protein